MSNGLFDGNPKDLLTAEQIALFLEVAPRTVSETWLRPGSDFPRPVYLTGRLKRWVRKDICDWVENKREAQHG